MTDTPTGSQPSSPKLEVDVPPEALEPSGRSVESLPKTAPNPANRDMEEDREDGSTELPPVTPDA